LVEKRLSALKPEQKHRFALFDNSEWHDLMPGGSQHKIKINANGSFGAIKPVEFTIDLAVYERRQAPHRKARRLANSPRSSQTWGWTDDRHLTSSIATIGV